MDELCHRERTMWDYVELKWGQIFKTPERKIHKLISDRNTFSNQFVVSEMMFAFEHCYKYSLQVLVSEIPVEPTCSFCRIIDLSQITIGEDFSWSLTFQKNYTYDFVSMNTHLHRAFSSRYSCHRYPKTQRSDIETYISVFVLARLLKSISQDYSNSEDQRAKSELSRHVSFIIVHFLRFSTS